MTIEERIGTLELRVEAIEARFASTAQAKPAGQTKIERPKITDDLSWLPQVNIHAEYGDPELKFMPRIWKGEDFSGRAYSQCPADLLKMVAEDQMWHAKNGKEEYRKAASFRAAKAIAWMKQKSLEPEQAPAQDDLPF